MKKEMPLNDQLLHALLPSPQFEDDLNVILDWLQPYEHQSQPPSLRIKNSIKRLTGAVQSTEFIRLFNEFYLLLVRSHYTSFIEDQQLSKADFEFDKICTLEEKLIFPCPYLHSMLNETVAWDNIKNLRHYFIDKYPKFREQLAQLLRDQVMNRDSNSPDAAIKLINWIDSSESSFLSSKDLLLDMLLERVKKTCDQRIRGHWTTSSSVISSYNHFLNSEFQHFTRLLGCSSDDQKLCSSILQAFQLQFFSIRISEVLQIFVTHFPDSKPAVIELNSVLRHYKPDFEQLLTKLTSKFLTDFKREFLNPSVRILEALLGFLKAVKCFMFLEPSGQRIRLITDELKSQFQSHRELISTLLYAMLNLNSDEFNNLDITPVLGIDRLSHELRVDDFQGGKPTWFDTGVNSQVDMSSEDSSLSENNNDMEVVVDDDPMELKLKPHLNYEIILQQYLMWTPDGKFVSSLQNRNQDKVNLLDVLLQMLGNRKEFVDEFVKLLGNKLLHSTPSYTLDDNWLDCLSIVRDKFDNVNKVVFQGTASRVNGSNGDADLGIGGVNDGSNYDDDDDEYSGDDSVERDIGANNGRSGDVNIEGLYQAQLNKIDVMLHDVKNSKITRNKITKLIEGYLQVNSIELYPKFLTALYWNAEEGQEIDKIPTYNNQYLKFDDDNSFVNDIVLACAYGHTLINNDQALRYLEHKSMIEIEINRATLPPLVLTVTMPQYCVLEKFSSSETGKAGLSLEEIVSRCNISSVEAEAILQFWTNKGVLGFNGSSYYARE